MGDDRDDDAQRRADDPAARTGGPECADHGDRPEGGSPQTGIFVAGHLLVWLLFSLLAAALQAALEAAGLISAGVYQWTPLKNACLRHCRIGGRVGRRG